MLAQMQSERSYERQKWQSDNKQWEAERQNEHQQWQNDNQQWSAENQRLADHCSALESQMTKEATYQQKEVRLKLHLQNENKHLQTRLSNFLSISNRETELDPLNPRVHSGADELECSRWTLVTNCGSTEMRCS